MAGKKWSVVIDGKAGKQYDVFVFDAKITFDSADTMRYVAAEGGKVYLVEEKITEKSAKP